MAFKLTKQELKQREALIAEARMAHVELETAVEKYNEASLAPVTEALDAYKEKLQAIDAWCEDIASSRQEEFDAKSDKWQEGDKAQSASEWIESFSSLDFDVDIELPEPLDAGNPDVLDEFASLPEEAE